MTRTRPTARTSPLTFACCPGRAGEIVLKGGPRRRHGDQARTRPRGRRPRRSTRCRGAISATTSRRSPPSCSQKKRNRSDDLGPRRRRDGQEDAQRAARYPRWHLDLGNLWHRAPPTRPRPSAPASCRRSTSQRGRETPASCSPPAGAARSSRCASCPSSTKRVSWQMGDFVKAALKAAIKNKMGLCAYRCDGRQTHQDGPGAGRHSRLEGRDRPRPACRIGARRSARQRRWWRKSAMPRRRASPPSTWRRWG